MNRFKDVVTFRFFVLTCTKELNETLKKLNLLPNAVSCMIHPLKVAERCVSNYDETFLYS